MSNSFEYWTKEGKVITDVYKIPWNELHREDGPSYIEYVREKPFNSQWYWNGKRHRIDGPAFITMNEIGICEEKYYIDGELHRIDGPADIEYNEDGTIYRDEYWFHGSPLPFSQIKFLVSNNMLFEPENWTEDQKFMYKLTFNEE